MSDANMFKFSLKLEPTAGNSVEDCIRDGSRIAFTLGLACVTFNGNGEEYLCYPSGKATKFTADGKMSEWDGKAWSA
jgi:hypothetical protein